MSSASSSMTDAESLKACYSYSAMMIPVRSIPISYWCTPVTTSRTKPLCYVL